MHGFPNISEWGVGFTCVICSGPNGSRLNVQRTRTERIGSKRREDPESREEMWVRIASAERTRPDGRNLISHRNRKMGTKTFYLLTIAGMGGTCTCMSMTLTSLTL